MHHGYELKSSLSDLLETFQDFHFLYVFPRRTNTTARKQLSFSEKYELTKNTSKNERPIGFSV